LFFITYDALVITPGERSYDAIAGDANATLSRRHRFSNFVIFPQLRLDFQSYYEVAEKTIAF
jgi:hypothetical protein